MAKKGGAKIPTVTAEDIGERAYLRHFNECGGKGPDGNRMPTWRELGARGRALFIASGMVTEGVNTAERDRLVELFVTAVVPCAMSYHSEPILVASSAIDLAERLADELMRRRRVWRGGV